MENLLNEPKNALYHFEHGNENLAYRMLIDLALDTQSTANFEKCIELANFKENNANKQNEFVEKCIQLSKELLHANASLQEDNPILIEAKAISKSYGKKTFHLGPLNLSIQTGHLIGLVGENGNGKTTLLRMLAKELTIDNGTVSYNIAEANKGDYALRTKLTYIPQRTPKWFGKVKDNLKLAATHYGIKPEDNDAWVEIMMLRFGLWSFRNYSWDELSSGYKMRFELARTFLRKPKLLLLDEPLANLDILSQQLILEDLKMLAKSKSNPLGIVLSSQQLYEVEKVSDEIIFLKNGKPTSLNDSKKTNTQNKQELIVEIEVDASKEKILDTLKNYEVNEIKLLGNNYYISLYGCSNGLFLKAMTDANLNVKYFRDITYSTRKFFN